MIHATNDQQMTAAFRNSAAATSAKTDDRPQGKCPKCGRADNRPKIKVEDIPGDFRFYRKLVTIGNIYVKVGLWQAFRSVTGSVGLWMLRGGWHIWSFYATVRSARLDYGAATERHKICQSCPAMKRRRRWFNVWGRVQQFCGECPCPTWPPAALSYKNWKARWNCPIGQHPGSIELQRCHSCGKV